MPQSPSVARTHETVEAEIRTAEDKWQQAAAATDPASAEALYGDLLSPGVVDIHASGWIYDRQQSIDLKKNMAEHPPKREIILARSEQPQIVVLSTTVVAVISMKEVYYAVPNPQSLALEAGTLTMDPEATRLAAAGMAAASGIGPGETMSPNPYRTRTTRIWVRENEQWRLALIQSTRIAERVRV